MSLLKDIKELKTGTKDLRKFGLTVGGVLLALGLWTCYRHKPFYPWLLWPGAALAALGAVTPRALKWIYLAWMTLALVLGLCVSTLLLVVFFYLVVTAVGLIARLFGNDFLNRKLEPTAVSYWIVRDRSNARAKGEYEQQF